MSICARMYKNAYQTIHLSTYTFNLWLVIPLPPPAQVRVNPSLLSADPGSVPAALQVSCPCGCNGRGDLDWLDAHFDATPGSRAAVIAQLGRGPNATTSLRCPPQAVVPNN